MPSFVYNITNIILSKSRFINRVLILFFTLFTLSSVYAQSELIEGNDYNRDSHSINLMLNSNGYSIGYRFSKRKDGYRSRVIDIDIAWVEHPKEKRIASRYDNQSKFVYGKLNQLLVARLGYGRQKEIYGKYSESGVAINYYYSAGASLALLKPVYFEVWKEVGTEEQYISTEKFDPKEIYNSGQIYGGASFFKGFNEIEPVGGAFAKFAFSFDINKKYKMVNAIELGVIFDLFYKKLPIMEYSEPQQYVFTMFLAYRFGKKRDHRITIE